MAYRGFQGGTLARTGAVAAQQQQSPFGQPRPASDYTDPFEGLSRAVESPMAAPPASPVVPAPVPMPSAPAPPAPPPMQAAAAAPSAAGAGAVAAAGAPSPALAGLTSALRDPGPGFMADRGLGAGAGNLGVRSMGQPLDILRQIVNQRGRLY
jgi:hypothetical protein